VSQTRARSEPQACGERAGIALRLWGAVLSSSGVALGLYCLFFLPAQCRLIGYVAAALFIPTGGWLLFASLRGRKSDLLGLSASQTADTAATVIAGQVVDKVIDNLG